MAKHRKQRTWDMESPEVPFSAYLVFAAVYLIAIAIAAVFL